MLEQRPRVLVVEDEESLISTLREELEEAGYTADLALTGEEALRKAKEHPPDLVLLDILLGRGIDGLAVLGQLKEDPLTARAPVVVLTNVDDEETMQRALDLGAETYFIKTRYSLNDLLDHIRAAIERARSGA